MHLLARLQRHWLTALFLAVLPASVAIAQTVPPTELPPSIVTQPASQTVNAGQSVTLSVVAQGSPTLAYQWWFNATNAIPFATSSSLVFLSVDALFSGSYTAVITNAFGSVTSAPAVLSVIGPPVITSRPTNQYVYVGQTATFSVTAFSRNPETYQWQFQGNNLPNATNNVLNVAQVTTDNAGFYTVQVANNNGTTTSTAAELFVLALPAPSLRYGVLTATNRVRVPVLYLANGSETNISFSAAWDPAIYTNPTFEPELEPAGTNAAMAAVRPLQPASLPPSTTVVLDESLVAEGRLGVQLAWVPGNFLPPGEGTLGQLVFDLVEGRQELYAGRLALTNQPVASLVSPPFQGQTNIVLNGIEPQMSFAGLALLNRQTGLMEQRVRFANPGRVFYDNARLSVQGLSTDSLTNLVSLANAQGFILPDFRPYVDWGAIAPGEVREGTLEYFVSDRRTQPTPVFTMFSTPAVNFPVPNGDLIDATIRRTNNMVLVEFPTVPLFRYYIQYANTVGGFTNGVVETSLPYIRGTGSRLQWLDSGPPRTQPGPANGELRFYRVLEVE